MESNFTRSLIYIKKHLVFSQHGVWWQKATCMISVFLLILVTLPTLSQPASARVYFIPAGPGLVQGVCQISLEDSTGIQSVELVMTDLMSKEVLFTREFVFDQTSGLPTGISWLREGTEVTLGLGTLPKKLAWQGVIRLKNGTGQWSVPYEFLFN